MKKRKLELTSVFNRAEPLVASFSRMRILSILKNNPMTISQIVKASGLNRSNVYHHLDILKRRGLVYEKKFTNKQGQPVMITIDMAKPLSKKYVELLEKVWGIEKELRKLEGENEKT